MGIDSFVRLIIAPVALGVACHSALADSTNGNHTPEVNIWVDNAPLSLMIEQLGDMSGLGVSVSGTLNDKVSGRFTGSFEDTLSSLSASHGVVFDLQGQSLHAAGQDDISSVSIAMSTPELADAIAESLGQSHAPSLATGERSHFGNAIEYREDSVRISGHPDFVKRTARQVTMTIADVTSLELESSSLEADPVAQEVEPMSDAGTDALLEDIQEESLPETERASLSKPIRWVTDIPGFTTF